jgi:uncharacterized membrane-anchored protein
MLLIDNQTWWGAPNSIRLRTVMVVALALGIRIYILYRRSKRTRKRSPKLRRIERIVAISLWSFILIAVTLLLIFKR